MSSKLPQAHHPPRTATFRRRAGADGVVYDAKTNEDLTCDVLTRSFSTATEISGLEVCYDGLAYLDSIRDTVRRTKRRKRQMRLEYVAS